MELLVVSSLCWDLYLEPAAEDACNLITDLQVFTVVGVYSKKIKTTFLSSLTNIFHNKNKEKLFLNSFSCCTLMFINSFSCCTRMFINRISCCTHVCVYQCCVKAWSKKIEIESRLHFIIIYDDHCRIIQFFICQTRIRYYKISKSFL